MSSIKSVINIIVAISILLLMTYSYQITKAYSDSKDNVEQLRHNLTIKDTKISNMTFSEKELRSYITGLDTKHKKELDSVFKENNIKIKNLIRYQKVTVQKIDLDTAAVNFKEQTIINDTIYKKDFNVAKKCLKIEGYILSKDSTSNVFITKTEGTDVVYITKSYSKTFWDRIFFRKGKEIITTTSECGDVLLDEIDIK
jgi:hypothetical protein